jgi:N-acetylneuraminate synthase
MEFSEEQWSGLKAHAEERGILFISSPFSLKAVELLERVGIAAWKIASGEINSNQIFERVAETGVPILLSTGMSSLDEIDRAVQQVKLHNLPLAVMQCTSAYPCPAEKIGLNMIPLFRERYDCAVGLSDHSGTPYPGLAASTLGSDVLEIHVTFNRGMFGPDVRASVTTTELSQLVEGIRFIEKMLANPVDKELLAEETAPLRKMFMKSVVARIDLPVGTVLREEHLALKKPGTGFPAARLQELLGIRLKKSLKADQLLHESDLEVAS